MEDFRTHLITYMEARGVAPKINGAHRIFHALLDERFELKVEDDPLRWPGSARLRIRIGFLPYAGGPYHGEHRAGLEKLLRRNIRLIHAFQAGLRAGREGAVSLDCRAGPELLSAPAFNKRLARLFALAEALQQEWGEHAHMPDAPASGIVRYL